MLDETILFYLRQKIWADPSGVKAVAHEIFTEPSQKVSTSDFQYIIWQVIDIRGLRHAIEDEGISPAAFRAQLDSNGNNQGWIHKFALVYFIEQGWSEPAMLNEWRLLARWMFTGIPLQEISSTMISSTTISSTQIPPEPWYNSFETPLICGLTCGAFIQRPNLNEAQAWLEDLLIAGVDLEAYGELERAAYEEACSNSGYWPHVWVKNPCLYLVSFTYGPRPQDWNFVWDAFVEDFAGEFWQLVEPPPVRIPGAWVDEDEDE